MPTQADPDAPAPAPPVADQSVVLAAAADAAGFDLDLDELVVCAGLESALTARLIKAAGLYAINRYTRSLLGDAEEFMRTDRCGEDGATNWPDELAEVTATATVLDAQEPLLTAAIGEICRRLADTRLGLAWPRADDERPDPKPPTAPPPPAD
jgi:hypothetical protein